MIEKAGRQGKKIPKGFQAISNGLLPVSEAEVGGEDICHPRLRTGQKSGGSSF